MFPRGPEVCSRATPGGQGPRPGALRRCPEPSEDAPAVQGAEIPFSTSWGTRQKGPLGCREGQRC